MIDRKRGFYDEAQETMPPEEREALPGSRSPARRI
jgi:hypothetical protein